MPSKTTMFTASFLALAILTGWSTVALSQGSGSSRTDTPKAIQSQTARPQTPDEFYNSFWGHLVKKDAAYNTWKSLAREKTDDGIENPHGETSRTYVNKIVSDDPKALPNGSILVREDYDDKGKRNSISVMYRVKDYDKDHGNWYWFKYLESGSIARAAGNKAIAGKVTSCLDCHTKSNGKDFVFSNDTLEIAKESKPDDQSIAPKKAPKE